MMNSKELTYKIVQEFPNLLPRVKAEVLSAQGFPYISASSLKGTIRVVAEKLDLIAEVRLPTGAKKILLGEIKSHIEPRMVREVIHQLKAVSAGIPNSYPLLIVPFISERVRQTCRESDVGYLDLAGNCYLNFDAFYLERIVPKNPFPTPKSLKTIFSPISSRILRVMLENPKRSWLISELAKEASVSLGQTSHVCHRLIEQEYVNKDSKRRIFLSEPGRLLDDWNKSYEFDKNEALVYYSFERSLERLMKKIAEVAKPNQLRYAFTLHSGASLIAPHLRGITTAQFYIENKSDLEQWISTLDLRPVESGGNVSLLIPYDHGVFYHLQTIKGIQVVGNIQLYLDLCQSPARGKEQADFLRQQKLSF